MSEKKYLCLLGFAQEAENKIKSIILAAVNNLEIEWVSAKSNCLDGVVINAAFLEAPQIQKYIEMGKCPMVCAHIDDEGRSLAESHNMHTINWSRRITTNTSWVDVLLSKKPNKLVSKPPIYQENQTPPFDQAETNRKILERIRSGEKTVFCATSGKDLTWIKPAEGVVYINYAREKVPGYDQWSWEEVKDDAIPASARQLKMDLWLFETLWQSQLDGKQYIDENRHFKLLRWPQPLSKQGRTEALRLAACAQSYPVDVQALHDKTKYSIDKIYRFLFATVTAGQAKVFDGNVKKIEKTTVSQMDEKKKEEKRGLLRRFREKLGL